VSLGEKEVLAAAQLAALGIDPARLPAVLANLQRIAQLAQPVNDVELGPEDELGPAWRP
jgi:gamma-glutamyl phosphate reductase